MLNTVSMGNSNNQVPITTKKENSSEQKCYQHNISYHLIKKCKILLSNCTVFQ